MNILSNDNDIYTINVKISSKRWYDIFGELELSVPISYIPNKDNDDKIIELTKKNYLNKTKNTELYNIIEKCFNEEKYSICNGSMPSLENIKTNKAIIYICCHKCMCCGNEKCTKTDNNNNLETMD
jgi:hypothetical protein